MEWWHYLLLIIYGLGAIFTSGCVVGSMLERRLVLGQPIPYSLLRCILIVIVASLAWPGAWLDVAIRGW